jgi:hypothetical protein
MGPPPLFGDPHLWRKGARRLKARGRLGDESFDAACGALFGGVGTVAVSLSPASLSACGCLTPDPVALRWNVRTQPAGHPAGDPAKPRADKLPRT